jgi:hypothetical protein
MILHGDLRRVVDGGEIAGQGVLFGKIFFEEPGINRPPA